MVSCASCNDDTRKNNQLDFPSLQLDAGVRGKAPGAETAAYIGALDSQLRLIGGCAMGGLAVAAHLFDAWCPPPSPPPGSLYLFRGCTTGECD